MEFEWIEELEIGDKVIDKQHQELVIAYNKLLTVCNSQLARYDKDAEILKMLDFLCVYTIQHFSDEEMLMLRCKFPEFEKHREIHEEFKQRAYLLVEKFKEWGGYSDTFALILRSQVGLWLIEHIKNDDSKIAEYLK